MAAPCCMLDRHIAVSNAAAGVREALLSHTPHTPGSGLNRCTTALGQAWSSPLCQSWRGVSAASPGRYKQLQEQGALAGRRVLIVPVLEEGPFCRLTQPQSCLLISRDGDSHNSKQSFE